jgi:RNA polymerase sigma-70 factor, ECF subfamily
MSETLEKDWSEAIQTVLDGNVDRFRDIVMEYQDMLRFTVAYYIRHNPERIDEIVNVVFLRAYQSLDRFEPGKPLGPWLKQIARNIALNELRQATRETGMKSELITRLTARARQEREAPTDRLELLRNCLDSLQTHSRELVALFYEQRHSVGTIARTLSRSAGSVRVSLLRIRRALKTCVEKG